MAAASSYYGLSANSGNLNYSNNGALTATGGGSALTKSAGTQTFNFNGFFMHLLFAGGVSGAAGSLSPPSANCWLLNNTSLEGITVIAGTWNVLLTLFTSDSSATGNLYVRLYQFNDSTGIFTQIGSTQSIAGTVTTSGTAFTATFANTSSTTFATGQKLYLQLDWNQTSGGSATNLMSVQVGSTTAGVPGSAGGLEIQLPPMRSAKPAVPPAKMPLISLNAPASSSDITYPPSRVDDALYGNAWRSVRVPSGGSPVAIALDLSGVPAVQRGKVVVNLLNEQGGLYYNTDTSQAASLPANYTLQGNAAAGGAYPATGWVTLVTVTGNLYPTRQHALDLTGYNWLQLSVTVSNGVSPNNDVSIQIDVHDAHLGYDDGWLFLGDSITLEGMLHGQLGGGEWGYGGALAQIIGNNTQSNWYPATIDGGNGGMNMPWAATNIVGLLNGFLGGYVALSFGTNDANQSFLFTPGDVNCTTYYTNLLACIDACLARNFTVIVPYIPYGTANGGNLGANAQTLNNYVDAHLATDRPTVLRGPQFWTLFQQNPNLLRSDGIHPTYIEVGGAADGHERMHLLWASWMIANVYLYTPPPPMARLALSTPQTASIVTSTPQSAAVSTSAPHTATITLSSP